MFSFYWREKMTVKLLREHERQDHGRLYNKIKTGALL